MLRFSKQISSYFSFHRLLSTQQASAEDIEIFREQCIHFGNIYSKYFKTFSPKVDTLGKFSFKVWNNVLVLNHFGNHLSYQKFTFFQI